MELFIQVYRIIMLMGGVGATNGQTVTSRIRERLPDRPTRFAVEETLVTLETARLLTLQRHRDTIVDVQLTEHPPTAAELEDMPWAARLECVCLTILLAQDPTLTYTALPTELLDGAIVEAFPGIERIWEGRFLPIVVLDVEASGRLLPRKLPLMLSIDDERWLPLTPAAEAHCEAYRKAYRRAHGSEAGLRLPEPRGGGWYVCSLRTWAQVFGSVLGPDDPPVLELDGIGPFRPPGV